MHNLCSRYRYGEPRRSGDVHDSFISVLVPGTVSFATIKVQKARGCGLRKYAYRRPHHDEPVNDGTGHFMHFHLFVPSCRRSTSILTDDSTTCHNTPPSLCSYALQINERNGGKKLVRTRRIDTKQKRRRINLYNHSSNRPSTPSTHFATTHWRQISAPSSLAGLHAMPSLRAHPYHRFLRLAI